MQKTTGGGSIGYLLGCSLVAALGGFLFGFDTAVISGTGEHLRRVFELPDDTRMGNFWYGFTVASALIGTIVGAIAIGRPADRYGRHRVLYFVAIFYFVSALGSAFPWDWYSFIFFRFVGGLAVGAASVAAPMYIAEISPARKRGLFVALTQFNIVFGITMAYVSNYMIQHFIGGEQEWRWMFGVESIPAALFFLLLFLTPESPRWLVANGRTAEATELLRRLGTDDNTPEEEVVAIRESLNLDRHSMNEPFFKREHMKPIMLAYMIAMFNQLSGINAVLYYAPQIFTSAGFAKDSAFLSSTVVGVVMTVFTMIALLVIDRIGRRSIMIVGSIGYIVSLIVIAGAFYHYGDQFDKTGGTVLLTSLIVYIAAHAFGQGSVIWVFISEIFPNRLRARGQAFGSFTHWFWAAVISWTFPVIAAKSGGHAFAFYAVMMVFQLIWVLRIMPETKGVPLEKIQKEMGIE